MLSAHLKMCSNDVFPYSRDLGKIMVGQLALTGGKILFVFFFKKQKDLEGRQEY